MGHSVSVCVTCKVTQSASVLDQVRSWKKRLGCGTKLQFSTQRPFGADTCVISHACLR